ncbi:adenylate kinase [Isosphaera pallida ATCC 43644]|jgi:adenylate kinase|uniref:Adenylate kinase n=1 Tax=Isosphaera pallida (strain ATCC 43644 / DSM 9630 / IS1B) TaxID=575540 RepID=E8R6G3_ISOPI|nr:nucleoside monophosphate kinase [Isosphaera pallida]ADV62874.1 adenylate kinase [Isosphaera pallida ATCC 43644]
MPETIKHKYRTVLLFGMPGSGKGTQGTILGHIPFYVHVSMGEVLRKLPKYGVLGQKVLEYTSRGNMVPDDLTIQIYERHITLLEMQELLTHDRHVLILDGIPRNYAQAERLANVLDVVQIFHLCINDVDLAIDRLKARALRENRLDDINDEVIQRRLKIYEEQTANTLSFYDPALICDIDATQAPLMVLQDIINRLVMLQKGRRLAGLSGLGESFEPGSSAKIAATIHQEARSARSTVPQPSGATVTNSQNSSS